MALVLRHLGSPTYIKYLILGLILLVLPTCKVPPASNPTPPPPGGVRIITSGEPQSFFKGTTCRYAICQSSGNPNDPSDRIAEGTFSLSSGSGVSDVENLVAGQYDLYIVVDVDSDGYTFSGSYPLDGDVHEAETDVAVDDTVIDRDFTLKTVAGEVSWTGSLSGDLFVDLLTTRLNIQGLRTPPRKDLPLMPKVLAADLIICSVYLPHPAGISSMQYAWAGTMALMVQRALILPR